MRFKIIISILVLMVAAFSVSGSTVAFFTAGADTSPNEFTAGTVMLGKPVVISGGTVWTPGQCNTTVWSIKNEGTKTAFVRVKPDVAIQPGSGGYSGPYDAWLDQIGGYYTYKKNDGTSIVNIVQGTNSNVIGTATISNDGNILSINFQLNSNYRMGSIQIYAGLPTPTGVYANTFLWTDTFSPYVQNYPFQTDWVLNQEGGGQRQVNSFGGNTNIYIKAHLEVYEICSGDASAQWFVPDEYKNLWTSETGDEDDWWYKGVGAPAIVGAGQTVTFGITICTGTCFNGSIAVFLDAEAVQTTHDAIDYIWPANPWNT